MFFSEKSVELRDVTVEREGDVIPSIPSRANMERRKVKQIVISSGNRVVRW